MECEFSLQDDGTYICQYCKFHIKAKGLSLPIRRACKVIEGRKEPTLIDMAKSAGNAVVDLVTGGVVSEEEQARRYEICQGCEEFDNGRCKLCKCFMALKTKIANSKCPIGKWG